MSDEREFTLQERFHLATVFAGSYDGADKIEPSQDQLLKFYGLYKQATMVSFQDRQLLFSFLLLSHSTTVYVG